MVYVGGRSFATLDRSGLYDCVFNGPPEPRMRASALSFYRRRIGAASHFSLCIENERVSTYYYYYKVCVSPLAPCTPPCPARVLCVVSDSCPSARHCRSLTEYAGCFVRIDQSVWQRLKAMHIQVKRRLQHSARASDNTALHHPRVSVVTQG